MARSPAIYIRSRASMGGAVSCAEDVLRVTPGAWSCPPLVPTRAGSTCGIAPSRVCSAACPIRPMFWALGASMRFRRSGACRMGRAKKRARKSALMCLYPSYAIVHVTRSVPAEHDARQPPGRERHHDGCEPVEDTMFARGGRYVLFESKFVDLEG